MHFLSTISLSIKQTNKNNIIKVTAVLVVSTNIEEEDDDEGGGRGVSSRSFSFSFDFCFCFLSFFFLIICEADGVNIVDGDDVPLNGDSNECFFDLEK